MLEGYSEEQNVYPNFSLSPPSLYFGAKVYLNVLFFYVTPSMYEILEACGRGKKMKRYSHFVKNLIHAHRWSCSGAILIMR